MYRCYGCGFQGAEAEMTLCHEWEQSEFWGTAAKHCHEFLRCPECDSDQLDSLHEDVFAPRYTGRSDLVDTLADIARGTL